jgi:hypothetical protein
MKTIVTHIGPDLDAITSIWLIKTFLPEWEEASFAFVPAGTTLDKQPPESNPEIFHVDTGFGEFDHHQTDDDICASMLVYKKVKEEHGPDPALERLIAVVNDVDHFREVFFPDPTNDAWDMTLASTIDGWRLIYPDNPIKTVTLGMEVLDGLYKTFQNKVWAEKELVKGKEFETPWGKGVAFETTNDEVVHLAQKKGYMIAIRKDPKKGYLRIKAIPKPDIDLTKVYEQFKIQDPQATWFLHASRHMILNGSSKNPDMKPSTLSLDTIISIVQGKEENI